MKIYLVLINLCFFAACDQPRTSRINTGRSNSDKSTTIIIQGEQTSESEDSSASPEDDAKVDDVTSSENSKTKELVGLNEDNKSCTWSKNDNNYVKNNSVLGDFNLCRSNTLDNTFYLQVKAPPTSDICFFPISEINGGLHYLGNASCVRAMSSNQIYNIEVIKNRYGFSSLTMNELLVVKNQSYIFPSPYNQQYPIPAPDAFKYCMDHALQFYQYYGESDESYCQSFQSLGIHSRINF